MKINIVGRQMNVWDEMKSIIETKLEKLGKYFNDECSATVTLSSKHNKKCIELNHYLLLLVAVLERKPNTRKPA